MKQYTTTNGATIIVGNNSRENDYITFELAKANDLWFHVANIPGAHVILQSIANNHNNDDIIYAANLAALNSKYKTLQNNQQQNNNSVNVNYCKVIDVSKISNIYGKVNIINYNTLKVEKVEKVEL